MYVKTQIIITGTLIFLIILVAIFAPVLSPYEYDQTNFSNALRALIRCTSWERIRRDATC